MSRSLVSRANVMVFAGLIAMLAVVGGLTWERFSAARSAREWSRHTTDVLATIKDLSLEARDAETGQRGFLLTGNEDYLRPYHAALDRIAYLEGQLQRLTADNAAQQDRLRALAPVLQHKLDELGQTIQVRRDTGFEAAARIVRSNAGYDYMQQIEAILAAMTADEQALLEQRSAQAHRRGALVGWLLAGGTALAILSLLWAARMLNHAWLRSSAAEAEQRTTAQRLRVSLDSLSQGVGVFDAEFRLTNWNRCFQVLLGLPGAMLRAGTPYRAFLEQVTCGARQLLETEDQIRHGPRGADQAVTYEAVRPDDHHLEVCRTSMPDDGFVLTISDTTKRVQAEAVLREAQKMQAIGQLTGGIAHDFNNLLTVILGNLEFVSAEAADPKLRARIERATWAAQRGATLTGQLPAFARRQPLEPAPIELAAIAPHLVPLLRRTLGEGIDVRYVETSGLWPAMADAAQLESAVLNLALNARDAMPAGGRLTIELANKVLDEDYARGHAEVAPGDYAMLAVSDTGHGMTAETAARVFEPFFTTKPDGKGTGLGLAMVYGFVKQSGGHVKIYSEPGEGTTVRLYLPRAIGAEAQAPSRVSARLDLPRGSATILVVEDEPAVREIAVAILADLGYRVLEAADGAEGLRVFGANAEALDLLLTDVVLPGELRGRELAARIRAVRPTVQVLFMSGYTENAIVHHGRLDDGVHLIGKPFKRDQLARRVAELVGTPPAASADPKVIDLDSRRSS